MSDHTDALGRWAVCLKTGIAFKVQMLVTRADGNEEFQGAAPDGTKHTTTQLLTFHRDIQILFNSIFNGSQTG